MQPIKSANSIRFPKPEDHGVREKGYCSGIYPRLQRTAFKIPD